MKNGGNSRFSKVLTLIVVAVWAALALGFGPESPSTWLLVTSTAFVFLLVGRMWGVEVDYWTTQLNPVTISFGDAGDDNNTDDTDE
jgi:hypothetical protein